MKKVLVSFLILLLCLGLCACGGKGGNDSGSTDANATSATEAEATQSTEEIEKKIDEYIAANQSAMDDLNEQFADSITFSLEREDLNLVYVVNYLFDVEDTDFAASHSGKDSYVQMFDQLKQKTGSDDVKLIVRFFDKDGNKIHDEIVDDNYTVTETEDNSTLEAYINSETFQSQIADFSGEGYTFAATVEDEKTVVFIYKLEQTIDPATYEEYKASRDEAFADSEIVEAYSTMHKLLDSMYGDVQFKIRIVDGADVNVYEHTLDFTGIEE